jgi:hypothetical protein
LIGNDASSKENNCDIFASVKSGQCQIQIRPQGLNPRRELFWIALAILGRLDDELGDGRGEVLGIDTPAREARAWQVTCFGDPAGTISSGYFASVR